MKAFLFLTKQRYQRMLEYVSYSQSAAALAYKYKVVCVCVCDVYTPCLCICVCVEGYFKHLRLETSNGQWFLQL